MWLQYWCCTEQVLDESVETPALAHAERFFFDLAVVFHGYFVFFLLFILVMGMSLYSTDRIELFSGFEQLGFQV